MTDTDKIERCVTQSKRGCYVGFALGFIIVPLLLHWYHLVNPGNVLPSQSGFRLLLVFVGATLFAYHFTSFIRSGIEAHKLHG